MSWRTRWSVYEYVRNSLWIVPALFVVLAIVLGVAIPTVDQHTKITIGISFGSDAARGVLGAIAGGMITFTGFVFSILLLAVQFGSSQFSPRMLRRFLRDPTTKVALGMFMATFVYALVVLRIVGTGANKNFVPSNSISLALLLLLLSMLMFLRLISRTTQGLRVAAVLQELGRDARKMIDAMYPDPVGTSDQDHIEEPTPEGHVQMVSHAYGPGILQSVDIKGLVEVATRSGVVIRLMPRLGDLIDEGAPIFEVYGGGDLVDEHWLQSALAIGDERTMRQDPAFAFRLLADISARALSPGVNDPTTATQALDQIELLLRRLGRRRLALGSCRDQQGVVRFWYRAPSWEDYLTLALDETRHYGEGSVQIMRRLRALLEDLRDAVPEFRRPPIDVQLDLVDAASGRAFADQQDRLIATARDRQGLGAAEVPRRPAAS